MPDVHGEPLTEHRTGDPSDGEISTTVGDASVEDSPDTGRAHRGKYYGLLGRHPRTADSQTGDM